MTGVQTCALPISLVTELRPGLFTVRLVTPDWCRDLLARLDAYDAARRAEGDPPEIPNSMHHYGVILKEAGLDAPMQWLALEVLSPFARELFGDLCPDGLRAQHAFLADYGEGRDVDLDLHVDQSEVTLDLCLGTDFDGGDLLFEGRRCFRHLDDPPAEGETFRYAHVPGQAVLHAGKNRHRAEAVTRGRRAQLVLWGRISEEPEVPDLSTCAPWCGARR